MNPLILQFHSPEEFRYLSSLGHWIAGYIFLGVSILALAQTKGFLKSKKFLWPGLIIISSLILIPYYIFHHGLSKLGLVWQVITLDPQQRQHFIMFNLIFIAGVVELLLSLKKIQVKWWQFILPAIFVIIGLMFLFHPQHGTPEALAYTVPYHQTLGTVILLTGIIKAAEVIWSQKYKILSIAWPLFLFISSIMLIMYREPEGAYSFSSTDSQQETIHDKQQR